MASGKNSKNGNENQYVMWKVQRLNQRKKKRLRNDDQMEIGWVSFGKKIGFNSSEMTKNVSIIH